MENNNVNLMEEIEKDLAARKEIIEKNGKGGLRPFMEKYYPNVKPIIGNYYGMDAALAVTDGNVKKESSIRVYYTNSMNINDNTKENEYYKEMLYWGMTILVGKEANKLKEKQKTFEFDLFGEHYEVDLKTSIETIAQNENFKISYDSSEDLIANQISNQNFVQKSNKQISGRSIFNIHEENSDRELSINNTGMWIFTAEALSVIGMTSSPIFRKNYIEYTKTLEQTVEVQEKSLDAATNLLKQADFTNAILKNPKDFENQVNNYIINYCTSKNLLARSNDWYDEIIEFTRNVLDNLIKSENDLKLKSFSAKDATESYEIETKLTLVRLNKNTVTKFLDDIHTRKTEDILEKQEMSDCNFTSVKSVILAYNNALTRNGKKTSKNFNKSEDLWNQLIDLGIIYHDGKQKRLTAEWARRANLLGQFPKDDTRVTIGWNKLGKAMLIRIMKQIDAGMTENYILSEIDPNPNNDDRLKTILTYYSKNLTI